MWKAKRNAILGVLVGLVYRALVLTWRYRVEYEEHLEPIEFFTKSPGRSVLVAHWHGDELALIGIARLSKFLTMVSESSDGSIMAGALSTMGFTVKRGSSSRGGVRALIAIIKGLRAEPYFISFAVDGPRGPRHEAKPGAHFVARKAGIQAVQLLVDCTRRWDFPRSWNKTYLPKPFARIHIRIFPLPTATKGNTAEFLEILNSRT